MTFKPPQFVIYEDLYDKENVSHFNLHVENHIPVCQMVQRPTIAFVPWLISPDVNSGGIVYTREDLDGVKKKLLFEDEDDDEHEWHDTSSVFLPDHVAQLYRYEEEYNQTHGFSISFGDSLNESQQLNEEARMATKRLYDYAEYSKDVYKYLREAERRHQPEPRYMRRQEDIDFRMRSILVDWLVTVAEEYELPDETLYLSVSLIDRFLSTRSVLKNKLQLVGTASLFIAAKYEDTYCPDVKEFVCSTAYTYSKDQVLRMESIILNALAFSVNVPTTYCFLQYISSVVDLPDTVLFLAQYLCELTLLEAELFLQFLPSQIAAAAVSLSNYTMGYEVWDADLEQATGYTVDDLSDVSHYLLITYRKYSEETKYEAVREKYSTPTYHGVSSIPPPPFAFSFTSEEKS